MSRQVVAFNNVFFRYPDGTAALNGISFSAARGESIGIVGANGAGKSTLLMQINGCLLPFSGAVTVGGLQLTNKTCTEIRRKVGVVFQNPDDQLFMPTVYEDVAFGLFNLGMDAGAVRERVMQALVTVGCADLVNKPPQHLSGGQKRSVAIATVTAMKPDILVMDEPSSNLDPKARRSLIRLLQRFGHTKIIAAHDLDLILDVCSRCLIVKDGRIVADAACDTVLTNKALLEENNLELPLSLQSRIELSGC